MQLDTDIIPYASPQNIKALISRLRNRGWNDPLDSTELVNRLDIPIGSVSRVSIALRFLKLIDEDGHPTDTAKRLREADEEEYAQVLGDLLKSAYKDVFYKISDISTASDDEISNAFRLFRPTSQKERMVTLFKALCQEAGLIPESKTPRVRAKVRFVAKTQVPNSGEKKHDNHDEDDEDKSSIAPNEEVGVRPPRTSGNSRYQLLHGFVDTLPEDGTWTAEEHKSWLDAIVALTNFLVKEVETKQDNHL